MPNLYVIAGCNGAGKTTASYTLLPEILNCKEFVNADEIARGLSPFSPEGVSIQAGRIMLERVRHLIREKVDFGLETTLSTKSYLSLLKSAKAEGYTIILFFLWLDSFDLAKKRVNQRVKNGGHSIPDEVIERRYKRGIGNLPDFMSLADEWTVADNSTDKIQLIADGKSNIENTIYNSDLWNTLTLNFKK